MSRKKLFILISVLSLLAVTCVSCNYEDRTGGSEQASDISAGIKSKQASDIPAGSKAEIDNSKIDFSASKYKHINNGGETKDGKMPYNVDAITGATLTVEGPGVEASTPLSIREIENMNDGICRKVYADSTGEYVYEGIDLYYILYNMSKGENHIRLFEKSDRVKLKDSNRATIAELSLYDVFKANREGEPILLAYGVGTTDEKEIAPFVFNAKNEGEHSEGYVDSLHNDDGCLKLVYNTKNYISYNNYDTFSNVAYIYVCEDKEPGFKHVSSIEPDFASPKFTDYIITFRGKAIGNEINMTVEQLENLVNTDSYGNVTEGGIGYCDDYSLANNAYWYVNTYQGLDLYKLLCYLGMQKAEDMGRAVSRTTLVTFNAADGRQSSESFSAEALSYPDAFGFYNKNAVDNDDGSYTPTNEDLVKTGYPVLLAYGVNNYPYTITAKDEGYRPGLQNSGGPMRVVFGKTDYKHANGSNQVQYLSEVIAGEDVLYNTHKYTDNDSQKELADEKIEIIVNSLGAEFSRTTYSVGDIEDMIYGENVPTNEKKAAKAKSVYYNDRKSSVFEGVGIEYLLLNKVLIPGTAGTATFSNGTDSVTLSLDKLFSKGYNADSKNGDLPSLIAFAKNGAPLVKDTDNKGYVDSVSLNAFDDTCPDKYEVDNEGGPLTLVVPSTSTDSDDSRILKNVNSITVDIQPDSYAHLTEDSKSLSDSIIKVYGEGLKEERAYTVADLESKQLQAKTLDFSVMDYKEELSEQRYRGIPLYELFKELGIKNNASDVVIYTQNGSYVTIPLSKLISRNNKNYVSPEKPPLCAILAYGSGKVGSEVSSGTPFSKEDGGPLRLIVPMESEDDKNTSYFVNDVTQIEVTANDIDFTGGHSRDEIYREFLDYEITLEIKNDDNEWEHTFTLEQLESLKELIVHEDYSVLELGKCEGIDLWKFVELIAGEQKGIEDPVSVTVYAEDGYKNDLLSSVYMDGLVNGIPSADGSNKPVIICYAIKGYPVVDSEDHEGYSGYSGNSGGPARIVVENVQGASVKYFNKLVVTIPGSGPLDIKFDDSIFD